MRYIKYILFILLLTGFSAKLSAQYLNIVCIGDTGHVYKVSGSEGSSFVWTVNGGTIVKHYGDSVLVNWGTVPGEYTIRIQEFSIHGCPALPVSATVLVSAPLIDLGSDIEICQGDSIAITANGSFYSYLWQDGSTNPTFIASSQGTISLEVTDQYGCRNSDNIQLTVHPLPRVNLGPDLALCGIESVILDAGADGSDFIWSTGEITRDITAYQGRKTIWVNVKDVYNCENSDSIEILSCSTADYFKNMPTAFTPNGDGVNDEWRIPELQSFPQAVVEIFDRWGNMVFRSEPGYSNPWDGTYQGKEMPMDSYYFIIRLNSAEMEPLSGTVTIIK
jgi:gliding motility-associated-like protein